VEAFEGRFLLSTLTVLNTNDGGAGSLRAAIATARSGDTIVFDSSLNGQTITLASGELAVNKSLDIEGPGAGQLAISGNGASRVFDVTSQSGTVTIAGLTIENGSTTGDGGGIENRGNLAVVNSTVIGNSALGNGGGGAGIMAPVLGAGRKDSGTRPKGTEEGRLRRMISR
jgi:hypothetical protein